MVKDMYHGLAGSPPFRSYVTRDSTGILLKSDPAPGTLVDLLAKLLDNNSRWMYRATNLIEEIERQLKYRQERQIDDRTDEVDLFRYCNFVTHLA